MHLFLSGLEAVKSKVKVQADLILGEASSWLKSGVFTLSSRGRESEYVSFSSYKLPWWLRR